MTRARYGEQAVCECCRADIEFHGKPFRRELAPGVSIVAGGWRDRGSDRFCRPFRTKGGNLINPGRRLHKPYRP